MKIGGNIRKIREINDLNQESVAKMLGMSTVAYGRIERDETEVSLNRVEQIAKVLNTDISTLLNFDSKYNINMQNNKGTIYTSVNNGTVNTLNESLLNTVAKLNEDIVRLNDIIIQLNRKNEKNFNSDDTLV